MIFSLALPQLAALPSLIAGCILASYLFGSLPFGYWIGLCKGVDIRTLGSKNIGFTNVLRVLGPVPGGAVFLLDTLKGVVGILLARQIHLVSAQGDSVSVGMPSLVFIGLAAVLGHAFSPFLRFKGGKGIATSLGMLLALSWQVGLIGLGVWIVVVAATRYVSLGSLLAAFSLPFSSFFLLRDIDRVCMLAMTIALLIFVTVKHRDNIRRLLRGTESKFGQRVAMASADEPREESTHV